MYMLRKLIALAITSGLAAKLYRSYMNKRGEAAVPAAPPVTRRRRAGTKTHQA
jgi:hypothetical protein